MKMNGVPGIGKTEIQPRLWPAVWQWVGRFHLCVHFTGLASLNEERSCWFMVSDIYWLWDLGPGVNQKIMWSDCVGEVVACLMVAGNRGKGWGQEPASSSLSIINSHSPPIYHILMNPSED